MPLLESSPQQLLSEAECLACVASGTLWATMRLQLLVDLYQQITGDNMPDASELARESDCFECYGPNDYTLRLMELALLKKILAKLDPAASTDPQALLDDAACFNCYGSTTIEQLMELVMLSKLSSLTLPQ